MTDERDGQRVCNGDRCTHDTGVCVCLAGYRLSIECSLERKGGITDGRWSSRSADGVLWG